MENCCRLVFYNRELFPILSSACARTTIILAGKCGSRRQPTTSFSEHVVVAKTSYEMLQIFSFSDLERAQPPSMEISVLTLVVKKAQWSFPGCLLLENRRENLKLNVVLVFESKALLFTLTEKEKNKPPHHHVIFIVDAIIEHSSRQISAREVAQLLKYFLT